MKNLWLVVLASAALAAVPSFFIGYRVASTGTTDRALESDSSPSLTAERRDRMRSAATATDEPMDASGVAGLALLDEPLSDEHRNLAEEVRELVGRNLSASQRDEQLLPRLRSLGRVDPEAAIRLASQVPGARAQRQALSAALSGWGETDGPGALAWLESDASSLSNTERSERLSAILSGYALAAPTESMQHATALSEETSAERRLKRSAIEAVQSVLINEGNVSLAVRSLEAVQGDALRQDLQRALVRDWASLDPQAASVYVNDLGEDAPSRLQADLIRSWAGIAPQEAADYLAAFGNDHPDFGRATAGLVMQWTEFDIAGPGEWLNTLPASNEVDYAVAVYTERAAREDPEGAMSWATSIQSDRLRTRMMSRVASEWNATDPGSFTSYVDEGDFSEEQRERLMQSAEREPGTGGRRWGRW